jgi:hypothetical protein
VRPTDENQPGSRRPNLMSSSLRTHGEINILAMLEGRARRSSPGRVAALPATLWYACTAVLACTLVGGLAWLAHVADDRARAGVAADTAVLAPAPDSARNAAPDTDATPPETRIAVPRDRAAIQPAPPMPTGTGAALAAASTDASSDMAASASAGMSTPPAGDAAADGIAGSASGPVAARDTGGADSFADLRARPPAHPAAMAPAGTSSPSAYAAAHARPAAHAGHAVHADAIPRAPVAAPGTPPRATASDRATFASIPTRAGTPGRNPRRGPAAAAKATTTDVDMDVALISAIIQHTGHGEMPDARTATDRTGTSGASGAAGASCPDRSCGPRMPDRP